jgi:hypothetical protein
VPQIEVQLPNHYRAISGTWSLDTIESELRQHTCRLAISDCRISSFTICGRFPENGSLISNGHFTHSLSHQSELSQPHCYFPHISLLPSFSLLQHATSRPVSKSSTLSRLIPYLTILLTMSPPRRRPRPQGLIEMQKVIPNSSPAFEILPVEVRLSILLIQ